MWEKEARRRWLLVMPSHPGGDLAPIRGNPAHYLTIFRQPRDVAIVRRDLARVPEVASPIARSGSEAETAAWARMRVSR
jgi:hypothetical protein